MSAMKILQQLPLWKGSPEIQRLAAGYTNQNFRVVDQGESYFARVGRELPQHGVSRKNERRCFELAARAHIAPEIVYADDGILVVRALAGNAIPEDTCPSDAPLAEIAQLLSQVHRINPVAGLLSADPAQRCLKYLRDMEQHPSIVENRLLFESILSESPSLENNRFIHGDPFLENFIDDGSRLWLIDWEYAGIGDPRVDLAFVAMNLDMSEEQAAAFVGEYPVEEIQLESVMHLKRVAALRDALWCLSQYAGKQLADSETNYSKRCWQRLELEWKP